MMDYEMAKIHQNELIAEADHERLVKQARGHRDGSVKLGFHFAIPLTGGFGRGGHRSATTT